MNTLRINGSRTGSALALALLLLIGGASSVVAELKAGASKVEVTDREAGPVNDPLYVKALALRSGDTTVVLITVDAVAIGEIGPIRNEYLARVRDRLNRELGIPPTHVLINASHCHGVVCKDVDDKTVATVREALKRIEPVKVGAGRGREDRISENRRIRLKSGREADVRHAYSFPSDQVVAEVGPIDPEIGVLRLDRINGSPLAIVYNFACHPIMGVPSGGNTADLVGFSSRVIEENLGPETLALFVQGCGGDINPTGYKAVDQPRDAEPLGQKLGLSTLTAARQIKTQADDRLALRSEILKLPRGDRTQAIAALEAEQQRVLKTLTGTTLNLKTFLPLAVKYGLNADNPAAPASSYLHEAKVGRADLKRLDQLNRENLQQYAAHILAMEELTRIQTNLELLRKHQRSLVAAGKPSIDVEISALRVGEFVLTTFPGELTVRIGLGIKARAKQPYTFVAGYTNGYIYYAPTSEQLKNVGHAQEDSDCVLAPEWQGLYEARVAALLKGF